MTERRPAPARILLVDDVAVNRDLFGAILRGAGHLVDVAADGESAWELTWSRRYDLVLMDLEMPGMNGFEAAARIRVREGVMSGVTIAALTATRIADAEQLSLWSGIDAFVIKPARPSDLVSRVAALLVERRADVDWAPVWRLHAFTAWTKASGGDIAAECLDEFSRLLHETAAAIHDRATATDRSLGTIARLCALSERYGFDELAAVSALYRGDRAASSRSPDPNLLGAIGRARHAIGIWRDEAAAPALPPARHRGVGVAALLRRRRAA